MNDKVCLPEATQLKPLVIFGTGDMAQLAAYCFRHDGAREVVAFTVDADYCHAESFDGLPLVDFAQVASIYPSSSHDMYVAIGYSKRNTIREQKYEAARALGYTLASYISPRASTFPDFSCGDNCFIFEDNTIQPFVHIGCNVTLWSGNHIGHHSSIGNHCFVTSHVVVSGGVRVEQNCFIGVNATIRDRVTIADHGVIGAGALILGDTEARGVYVAEATQRSNARA